MSSEFPVVIDPDDPRAPPTEIWARLTPAEKQRVLDELPSEIESALPPEGDIHRKASLGPLGALDAFFKRTGRRVYLSSNLPVYYPAERMFAPDLIAVVDVEPHDRQGWVVDAEGKGLDFALEILFRGDNRKDLQRNVQRYAALGIQEYFIFDRKRMRLIGYSLPESGGAYQPIIPQEGRWPSKVLGLEFGLESERLRLFVGTAQVPELGELVARAEAMLSQAQEVVANAEQRAEAEAQRAEAEAQRAEAEAQRAEAEAQRADQAEAELSRVRAELEALKRQK
jgi:Uma2 family endonuclease